MSDISTVVREALQGDSNDAEHDALVRVADALGIQWETVTWPCPICGDECSGHADSDAARARYICDPCAALQEQAGALTDAMHRFKSAADALGVAWVEAPDEWHTALGESYGLPLSFEEVADLVAGWEVPTVAALVSPVLR